jgi:hypothetical protein
VFWFIFVNVGVWDSAFAGAFLESAVCGLLKRAANRPKTPLRLSQKIFAAFGDKTK